MDVHVTLSGGGDLAGQIYRQLFDAVLDGRLRTGERLPPSRELARDLAVSRNTVAAAYDRLTAEGVLAGRVGAGTYVSAAPAARSRRRAPERGPRPRAIWADTHADTHTDTREAGRAGVGTVCDFSIGMPDGSLFPIEAWRRLVTRQWRGSVVRATGYADPAGHAGLREAVARHVGVSRSVRAGAEDVVITQGAQQALDLIARVLVEPGGCVAVEEPGYGPARHLFASLGARVMGVPVDGEGLVVDRLPSAARLVYTTPSHQFPLGVAMSMRRRTELLEWAREHDAVIVEDDYDSEFRFSARPLEPLQSLDRHGRVLYVGTFSKTLLPMLRIGFVVAPASVRSALAAARRLTDWHGDPTTQAALAGLIDDGLLARHVRRASKVYAARHELITAGLADGFGRWLSVVPSSAGLHLCATSERSVAEVDAVVALASERGVVVQNLADFSVDRAAAGLVLGYGGAPVERIEAGLGVLADCFR